jgi:hypothetical protein
MSSITRSQKPVTPTRVENVEKNMDEEGTPVMKG